MDVSLPEASFDHLWETYCFTLPSCHYSDEAVRSLWGAFSPVLRLCPLLPIQKGQQCVRPAEPVMASGIAPTSASATSALGRTITHFFHVDLRRLGNAALSAVTSNPQVILPLLEFFRAIVEAAVTQPIADDAVGSPRRKRPRVPEDGSLQLLEGLFCVLQHGNPLPYEQLGAARLGQFVFIAGTVVRLSPPRIVCTEMVYRCASCSAVQRLPTEDGLLVFPTSCQGGTRLCRSNKFVPDPDLASCEEIQLLKMQEQTGLEAFEASSAASVTGNQMMEAELRNPFLDQATAGEMVLLGGILTARRGEGASTATQRTETHQLCLRVLSVARQGATDATPEGAMGASTVGGGPMWECEEVGSFFDMARQAGWMARLVRSFCPSIFGHEGVKAGLLLAMVGGSTCRAMPMRPLIHVLMVGDPGLGKSQLLRAACAVAPRSALVCVKSASACGLTVTLSRDTGTGATTFEAGAVVHGDGGITCIDEIDKGVSEHKALLEVMEQQTVSIAKAGSIFSMPVRTAIIAAGNPIGGHYDPQKAVPANLNLSPALLSRFDVTFVLCDNRDHVGTTNAVEDATFFAGVGHADGRTAGSVTARLAGHVLRRHRAGDSSSAFGQMGCADGSSGPGTTVVPLHLLRRFLAYAQTQCQPVMTSEACDVLRAHYLSEREQQAAIMNTRGNGGSLLYHKDAMVATEEARLPITPRYLQSLIRMTEARAKLELRDAATVDDAHYAIRLMQSSTASATAAAGHAMGDGMRKASGKRTNARDAALLAIRAAGHSEQKERFSYTELLDILEGEPNCRNPKGVIHQLNEVGLLLQVGGKYVLKW